MGGNKADQFEVNLSFPIRASLIVGLLIMVLSFIYWWISGSLKESFLFFAAATAAGGGVLAAVYAAKALNNQVKQNEEADKARDRALEIERQRQAMAYAARWNEPHMERARAACRKVIDLKGSGLESIKKTLSDSEIEMEVVHMLNFLEEISVSANHDVADSEILRLYFEDAVVLVWRCMGEWVRNYRTDSEQSSAWVYLEQTYSDWQ